MKTVQNMFKHSRFVHKSVIYILLTIALASCSRSTTANWQAAIVSGNIGLAAKTTDTTQFPTWESETQNLMRTHNGIEGISLGHLAPAPAPNDPDQSIIMQVKLIWNDGAESCLRIRETQDNKIQILDPAYQPCN